MNKISTAVSVIIPVYNDPDRLRTCLQALEEQTYPKDAYEVIVVDNGSDESIEQIVAGFRQSKASFESYPGSYAARNRGISLARGEIFAFTDSDCIPAPDWIERGAATLQNVPNCGIVGGKVEMFFKDSEHPMAAELYDIVILRGFQQKRLIEEELFAVTANIFTFKKVFEQVGYFDKELKSGGDKKWCRQVASFGYTLAYAADARVEHPARDSFAKLLARHKRVARGFVDPNWKESTPPLTWSYQSLRAHLSPLPPVFKIMGLTGIPLPIKIQMLVFWFIKRYVEIEEKLRRKLKLPGSSLR